MKVSETEWWGEKEYIYDKEEVNPRGWGVREIKFICLWLNSLCCGCGNWHEKIVIKRGKRNKKTSKIERLDVEIFKSTIPGVLWLFWWVVIFNSSSLTLIDVRQGSRRRYYGFLFLFLIFYISMGCPESGMKGEKANK